MFTEITSSSVFVFKKQKVFWLKIKSIKVFFFLELLYWDQKQIIYDGVFFRQNYLKDIVSWLGPKCASGFFYNLDVCHRDDFITCFPPRVIWPPLTNNMVLFSGNGTNSSILRRGDDFATKLSLSEPVPMFSTRLLEFYVSIVFLLHCKNRFSFKKISWMWTNFFLFDWSKETFINSSDNNSF